VASAAGCGLLHAYRTMHMSALWKASHVRQIRTRLAVERLSPLPRMLPAATQRLWTLISRRYCALL
jgi:hypothetical protein